MATIVTRTAKGSELTFAEVDGNFTNLNADGIANTSSISNLQADKLDKSGGTMIGALVLNSNLTTNAKVITNSAANSQSGSLVTLTTPGTEIVRLTNVLLTSLAGCQAGTAGQKLILSNRTGTAVTVLNESSSASTAADQISTGSGSDIIIQNNASISLIYDGSLSKWNIIGGTGSGTGSSGINYILNPDASIGTTGYVAYNDGTAAPVDGSGGTPASGLWVRSTTTPLRGSGDFNLVKTGSVSYLGNGVAYDFTIDNADLAKVLTVTFDYEVVSGTYATGDATVYVIQDPAGTPVVIQPAGYQIQSATVGTKMKQIATFQTASNVTSYRLCIHVASASTSDYVLALDSISVGPQVVQYGAPVTDKQNYTLSVTAVTTNPTFGTQVVNQANWRRVGDSMEIQFQYRQSSAGTAGSGIYLFSLPSGYQIDTTKLNLTGSTTPFLASTIVGNGSIAGSGNQFTGYVAAYDATRLYLAVGNDTANPVGFSNTTAQNFSTAVFHLSFIATVPILGWSSTVQMSNDTDTRVVAAKYGTSVAGTLGAAAPFQCNTKTFDTHNAVTTGSGWKFTAPVPGYYRITALVAVTTPGDYLYVYKNGSNTNQSIGACASATALSQSGIIELLAGDYVDIRTSTNQTVLSKTESFISVERLSGPSAIAATETVAARYTTVAGQSIPNTAVNTTVNFDTKDYDTHGAVTAGASWVFRAPISGKYQVSIYSAYAVLTWAAGNACFSSVLKNGVTAYTIADPPILASATDLIPLSGGVVLSLNAGDTLAYQMGHNRTAGAASLFTGAESNFIQIVRVGN